ncbi:MAG: response regulator [Planctomycetaceae bacterium]|nr:response regulator [Planctomycetaceae bacterium]
MAVILLADDSPTHTALMRSLLEEASHVVHCVGDGLQLMQALDETVPDLVVTDLRMPEMNGMQVVQEIAARYSTIPTVVVTSPGSENLAVDALALGAANFVPKNSLRILLDHVVCQTLQLSQADRLFDQLSGKLLHPEFSMTLSNHLSSIRPAVTYFIQSLAAAKCMDRTQRIRVATAVVSALFNAICFGNLEVSEEEAVITQILSGEESGHQELRELANQATYRDRHVSLKVSIGEHDTRVLVSHNGPGRSMRTIPAPGTPESFELEQCRGLMLITSVMDDVKFQSDYSEVVMIKQHA